MNVTHQPQSVLKSVGGNLMHGNVKSLFEFNEMGRLAIKTNPATHNIQHVVVLWSTISNLTTTQGVRGAIHPRLRTVLSNVSTQHGAALTRGWILFLTLKPREGRAREWGSLIVMCHNFPLRASHSGYGRGQRCNRGSPSQAQRAEVICTELFVVRWKQLGQTGDLIRFQSKHSAAGSRRLSPNIVANCICLHFPQLTVQHQRKRNLDGTGTISKPQRAPQPYLNFLSITVHFRDCQLWLLLSEIKI